MYVDIAGYVQIKRSVNQQIHANGYDAARYLIQMGVNNHMHTPNRIFFFFDARRASFSTGDF